jgi:hypothetical protein
MTDPQAPERLAKRLFLLSMAPDPSGYSIAQWRAICALLSRSQRGR